MVNHSPPRYRSYFAPGNTPILPPPDEPADYRKKNPEKDVNYVTKAKETWGYCFTSKTLFLGIVGSL
jgi:hypothetical protein